MSSHTLLIALLLVLVVGMLFSGLLYLGHRHPNLTAPLMLAFGGVGLVVAVVVPIVIR
ncbi:hypothetical protein [Streptomyces californicus]|uniref:hypothetical protein n=1 Tax=Streptomyces californicus TaxID=67351 RepID=UPI0037B41582